MRVQRNNQYYTVMSFIEQVDKHLLEREGLYENGAIYKGYTDVMSSLTSHGFEKKNRDEVPGTDDLQQFLNGLHLADLEARRKFIYDNVNIPACSIISPPHAADPGQRPGGEELITFTATPTTAPTAFTTTPIPRAPTNGPWSPGTRI